MMIDPATYVDNYKDKNYEELLIIRDKLLEKIYKFEKNEHQESQIIINPSPEVVYQCNLQYLSELLKLIAEKYNKEKIWDFLEENKEEKE